MSGFQWNQALLPCLREEGIEPDQRMLDAIQIAHWYEDLTLGTGTLFVALQLLNTRGFGDFPDIATDYAVIPTERDLDSITPLDRLRDLLDSNAEDLRRSRSWGATQYLRFIIEHAIKNPVDSERPIAIQKIARHYTGRSDADLGSVPELQRLLGYLRGLLDGTNDYQYFLTICEGRTQFRIASDLVEGAIENERGSLIPQKTLLTHLGDLGFFTSDSIRELEELLNSEAAREQQFQDFFERYPHFLRIGDHREVHPHVYLAREEEGPLIPDFILTNREAQRATLVELKRANLRTRLVRHQDNRVRFSDAIMEAKAQLLAYRDWFELPDHRRWIKRKLGMEVYRPRLMVIIGRASEFVDGVERAALDDTVPEVDVLTYDDLLRQAAKRRIILGRATR